MFSIQEVLKTRWLAVNVLAFLVNKLHEPDA